MGTRWWARTYSPTGCDRNSPRSLRDSNSEYVSSYNAPLPVNLGNPQGPAWGYLNQDWPHYSIVVNMLKVECIFGNLASVLRGKSLAVHHANFGTSLACLLAGIPQLVFPSQQEQILTAKSLEYLGVATLVEPPTQEGLLTAITDLPQLTQNAQLQAERFAYWNQNFLDRVVQFCLNIIS